MTAQFPGNNDSAPSSPGSILVVDDHPPSLFLLESALSSAQLGPVVQCQDSRDVVGIIQTHTVGALLLDLRMPYLCGEELLKIINHQYPELPVLIVTGTDDVATAVRCMKNGAFDYVVKPVDRHRLATSVRHALTVFGLRDQNRVIRANAQQTITQLAYYDRLTGLPNRHLVDSRVAQTLVQARRHDRSFAILCMGIDRFTRVNDMLGDGGGDQLLTELTARIVNCVRDSDCVGQLEWGCDTDASLDGSTVGRIGSDEFVIVLSEIHSPHDSAAVAQRIRNAVAETVVIASIPLHLSASIGIAVYPEDGSDGQTLLQNANSAMHHVKESGCDNFQFYTVAINSAVRDRLVLENELHIALEQDQFELFYQPRFASDSVRLLGVEALIRWHHPDRGLLGPDEFISTAEESGLIHAVGDWVVRRACAQMREWHQAGRPAIRVSVNLAAMQFRQDDLVSNICRALNDAGAEPAQLELELTESSLLETGDKTLKKLYELKSLGVSLAIDDFGTGFSSLSYLKRFPVDVLKIDRSFVSGIGDSGQDDAIVEAIIALGRSLGLQMVGEGIETPDQRDFLVSRGCNELQGFLLGRPVPAAMLDFSTLDSPQPNSLPSEAQAPQLQSVTG